MAVARDHMFGWGWVLGSVSGQLVTCEWSEKDCIGQLYMLRVRARVDESEGGRWGREGGERRVKPKWCCLPIFYTSYACMIPYD